MSRSGLARAIALIALVSVNVSAGAQMWRLEPDVSFGLNGLGWEPVDTAIFAGGYFGARGGGYVKAGYGFALDNDYYLILPERESAIHAYLGYDMISGAATGFSPDGAAEISGPYRNYSRLYADVEMEQLLAGDRRVGSSWLMLSLGDVSRYVMPEATAAETEAPEAFFSHSPSARLSFKLGPKRAFWETAALSGGLGAVLEAGHSPARSAWAFLVANADLGFKLPIAGKYLYTDARAALSALARNFTPSAPVPAWAYLSYVDSASLAGSFDLKCRAIETNPMVPIAVEFGVGAGAVVKAADLVSLEPLAAKPILRAFADIAIEGEPIGNIRLRAGIEYDPETGSIGMLFRTID